MLHACGDRTPSDTRQGSFFDIGDISFHRKKDAFLYKCVKNKRLKI